MESETSLPGTNTISELPFEFTGNAKEYFGIWIVNILLTIITFGIYSAWAKVRTKRYFYGNTVVNNDRFDYLADPVAILKGWLIAILFYIFYSVATALFPPSIFVFMIIFLIGLPWLVIRSLAFRARNTAYKNIRFNFNQKYSEAIKIFVGYSLLIPLTLGLLYPFVVYKQKQFLVDNSSFGRSSFSYSAKIKDFYKVYAVFATGLVILSTIFYFAVQTEMSSMQEGLDTSGSPFEDTADVQNGQPPVIFPIMIISVYAYMLVAFGYLQARIQNLLWNNAEIDNNQFKSKLRARDLIWIYFSNALIIILTFGLMIPWTKVRLARYRLNKLTLLASSNLDQFIASEEENIKAIGEEMSEVFNIDIGI